MRPSSRFAFAAAAASLLAAHSAAQDFSGFTTGSIDGQFGWTMRDSFGNSVVAFDQSIADIAGTKVFQISNAVTSSGYSNQVFSPVTTQVAGESTSSLWNDYGTNNTAPLNPPLPRANATTNRFYSKFSFRSATGAAQPGLAVTLSPSAKQSTVRMGYLQLQDTGSGIDLNFYDTTDGLFNLSTIASGLSYAATHTIEYQIDFVDGVNQVGGVVYGNDVVRVYLDGQLIHTGTTWESYYYLFERINPAEPRKQAVDSMLFRVSGTAAPATAGLGFHFTQYENSNTPPPPPATQASGVVAVNGGSSWEGWSYYGNSRDAGIYGAQSRNPDFDIYYTSFRLPAGAVATGANRGNALGDLSTGSFQAGDLIVGIGVNWKNGQRGSNGTSQFLKFDRNGSGTQSASTSVAPAAGNGVVSSTYGGTGYVQFNTVPYAFSEIGAVSDWFMRSPAAPIGSNIAPTGTNNFLNSSRNFWGQTFGTDLAGLYAFKEALPIRTYGVADGSGLLSYQWLINSSAFDRAGEQYSAPFQAWANNWNCVISIGNSANDFMDAVALDLPLLSYSFGAASATTLPDGATPVDLAVADIDGDSDKDFVALSQSGPLRALSVGVNTAGSFAASNLFFGNSTGKPVALVTGEFDGAAGVDVAVLTANIPPAAGQNRVYVFANNGTGSFSLLSQVDLTGMASPSALAVGNLNGGSDDLIVTDAGSGSIVPGKAAVLLNGGGGAFAQTDLAGFTKACRGAAVADLNGDSNADVAVSEGNSSSGNLHVFYGDGLGGLTSAGSPAATSISAQRVLAVDLESDGDTDLVVSCTGDAFGLGNGKANVFVNDGSGALARSDFDTGRGPVAMAAGSFEDAASSLTLGRDLVVANLSSATVSILGEWTAGAFSQAGVAATSVLPVGLAVADMDGNGYGDLVYADAATGKVLVANARILARTDSYGLGTAGTGGLTPVLSPLGAPAKPILGLSSFGLRMSNCRLLSPTVVVLSDGIANPLTQGLPLISSILTSWVELSDFDGNAYVALPIPNNPAFLGAYLYAQGAVFDANASGSFFPGLALSQGLRLRLGN